jgi:outer membrane protein
MWRLCILWLLLFATGTRADSAPKNAVVTLEQALATARAGHPQLRQAEAATELARGKTEVARAPLLPQLAATAAYQRTTANTVFRPGFSQPATLPDLKGDTYNFYNFGVSAAQLLLDLGGSVDTFLAARNSEKAQAISQRTTDLAVDYGVRKAFFAARAAKATLVVAVDALRNQERHLDQVQSFVEVGTRPEIDLAQVRADVASARMQWIDADSAYASARAALNQAMGIVGPIDFDVPDDTLSALPDEEARVEDLYAKALAGRPDLRALGLSVDAQTHLVRASKALLGPQVLATGALTDAGKGLGQLRWNWNVGIALNWNLLQGGQRLGVLRQAKAGLEALRAQGELLRQGVMSQLQQAVLTVQAGRASLLASADLVKNARIRLGLAEGRYEAGVGNIIELGDAQVALTRAENQRVQAEFVLALARAQLLSALGRAD